MPSTSPFLEDVRRSLRVRHYSLRTEKAYIFWIKRFILFSKKQYPTDLNENDVAAFLSFLATKKKVSASTQNQAFNAIVYLYAKVLARPLGDVHGVVRAKRPQRLPAVLSRDEVSKLMSHFQGKHWIIAGLLYGSGLRIMECLRLRVKDFDFHYRSIVVRDGKGGKDRVVTLPTAVTTPLQRHLEVVKTLHEQDVKAGFGAVYLPSALARKYPTAPKQWGWQYVFPASKRSTDPYSGVTRRHHLDPTAVQKQIRRAARLTKIEKPVGCHTLRHSFATHLLEDGANI